MAGANRIGQLFQVTTFGESHGPAIGCLIDGCPAGVEISFEKIQNRLDKRRPGQAAWVSARNEPDQFEILSGIYQGRTTGTPIAAIIRNVDQRSSDYQTIVEATQADAPLRVGHADDLWLKKFGHADLRGGGRASGRETASRVLAGAFAEQVSLAIAPKMSIQGRVAEIGELKIENGRSVSELGPAAEALLVAAVKEGRSHGGVAEIEIQGLPLGLGQPVFHKFKADLAAAYMGIGATIGVEFGAGFRATERDGTEFHGSGSSEKYGGIRGGITTGEPVFSRIAFKPTSTVMQLAKRGRHDPCIVPRAVPVLEAMSWLIVCNHLMWKKLDQI